MKDDLVERDLIVAWLRVDAKEYEDGGPFGKVACAAVSQAAEAIARGEHLPLRGAAIRALSTREGLAGGEA